MVRATIACGLLAIVGGCSYFQQGPNFADRTASDGRSPLPSVASTTKWSQNGIVGVPPRHEDLVITRMGVLDVGQGASGSRTPAVNSSSSSSVRTTGALAAAQSPSSTATNSSAGTTSTTTERTADVTITKLSTSSSSEKPIGRVISADTGATSTSSPVHASQSAGDLKPTSSDLKPTSSSLDVAAGPSLDVSDARPGKPRELKPGLDEIAAPKSLTATAAVPSKPPAGPVVRLVNKKRVTLNYEVKDIGPSGVSGVELWYTRDAKDWRRHDSPPETKPPYIIEVQEEGLYGFTLLAKNGIGLSKEPPHRGDVPQVWVEVDLSRPTVSITDVKPSFHDKAAVLSIQWKASDKNLGSQPITISYAEKADGPWQLIASNLDNSGQCLWPLRPGIPPKMYVRVEAKDLAGNVGVAQTSTPVQVDMSRPTVQILDVESNSR